MAMAAIIPRDAAALARLEWADVRRSRWLVTCIGLYGALGALFVTVGLRESSVVGFTGMGRVLFSLSHALVVLLPLVALSVSGQTVSRARDDGSLELLLSQPLRRTSYLAAVTAVRFLSLVVPLVIVLLALGAVARIGFGDVVPWALIVRASLVSAALLWAFVAIGIAISTRVRSPARATTALILCWIAAVALLDFGLVGILLRWPLDPRAVFLLAGLNPVQAARLALLSAAEPDLATLGPVGFYLANTLGPRGLLVFGLLWPLFLGIAVWLWTLRAFRRGDAI
ncbi:MAG: ABC transporter permease [Deltaproteobacteria bacterium]|jgi:ABC-type transport system involved in multi-copper enzyme maturation permease subunit|nr:ABC transporter permease [Deltaproteobacteria bacterium]MBW2498119.1 ABC transporter permease [Deltaproteobacteria bacterium]